MNNTSQLYERMLEAFPVLVLKTFFQTEGTKSEVIHEIVKKFSTSDIDKFVCDNFGFLHQHIFIREINGKIANGNNPVMSGKLLKHDSNNQNSTWYYLHKTRLRYYDTKSNTSETLEFLVPVKIHQRGKTLIISYNTFARDIKTYFNYVIYIIRHGNLEEEIVHDIKNYYPQVILKLDLNKGIKYLWDKDFIDGLDVKNRQPKSVRQDRMDENFLYKVTYLKDWTELMKTPLQKTKFKTLKNPNIKHFECNPSTGFIGITIHSENEKEVNDLISLILKNN